MYYAPLADIYGVCVGGSSMCIGPSLPRKWILDVVRSRSLMCASNKLGLNELVVLNGSALMG